MNNRPMAPGQAADYLGVGTTALKKYASLLEQNGHTIGRNDKNHRLYVGEDIALIRAMLILNRHKSVPLEEAASIVTSAGTDIAEILSYDDSHSDTHDDVHTTEPTVTTTHIAPSPSHVPEFVTQFIATLQEQASAFESMREEMREQNKKQEETIEALRKEIEALRNEQANKPTSIWARLFGR